MVFAVGLSYGLVVWKKENIFSPYVKKHFKEIFFAGLLFFLHFWIWFHAVGQTTIANATLLFCMNPLFIAISAWYFQKQRLTWPLIIALVLGILGLSVMEYGALELSPEKFLGDMLALVAALAFTGYVLSTKRLRAQGSNYVLIFWFNIICVVGFGVAALASGQEMFDYGWVSWASFIGMAVGPSLLGHALFSYSLRYLNPAVASSFVLLEPVFAAVTAALVFDESVSRRTIYGFVIISAGLVNLFLHEMKLAPKKQPDAKPGL